MALDECMCRCGGVAAVVAMRMRAGGGCGVVVVRVRVSMVDDGMDASWTVPMMMMSVTMRGDGDDDDGTVCMRACFGALGMPRAAADATARRAGWERFGKRTVHSGVEARGQETCAGDRWATGEASWRVGDAREG